MDKKSFKCFADIWAFDCTSPFSLFCPEGGGNRAIPARLGKHSLRDWMSSTGGPLGSTLTYLGDTRMGENKYRGHCTEAPCSRFAQLCADCVNAQAFWLEKSCRNAKKKAKRGKEAPFCTDQFQYPCFPRLRAPKHLKSNFRKW